MLNLLRNYIKLYLNESKLTPGSSSEPGRNPQNTNVYKGKNEQTPGMAGGHGHIDLFKTKIFSPDDGYHYQAVYIDGPQSDFGNGKTYVTCKVNEKFKHLLPESLQELKISSSGGPDAEAEVFTRARVVVEKILTILRQKTNGNALETNIYNVNPQKQSEPTSF